MGAKMETFRFDEKAIAAVEAAGYQIQRIPVDRFDWLREDIELVRDFIRSR
jgi:hypothetical protein